MLIKKTKTLDLHLIERFVYISLSGMPENQLAIAKLYIHFCCTTYDESLTLALPSSRLFPHPSYFAWLLLLIE